MDVCDERGKATVLLMVSTGMKIGALPVVKLKRISKWEIDYNLYSYQITVYSNSQKDRYITFCTLEATKAIHHCLSLRKRYGEKLKFDENDVEWFLGDSYLLTQNFSKDKMLLFFETDKKSRIFHSNKKRGVATIRDYIVRKLEEIGFRTPFHTVDYSRISRYAQASQDKNELHTYHLLRMFAVTYMQRARVDKTIREILVGHSTGLDCDYYKPVQEEILKEYLKTIELLTINNTNSLQRPVEIYIQKGDKIDVLASVS